MINLKILAIGAHPDDVEIGCGGVLSKLKKIGHEINIYILTYGEAGGGSEEDRRAEATTSAKILGVKEIYFGEFKDTKLLPNGELVNSIEKIVNKINPDMVLTHSPRDEHHDHKAAGSATTEAARYVQNILNYENPLTKDFTPQIFVDITNEIEEKISLLSCFESQREKTYLKNNAIYGLAQYRAYQSRIQGIQFAEAFQVTKLGLFSACEICLLNQKKLL